MHIAGIWHKCDDGVIRPVLVARVRTCDTSVVDETFLIDSGADRTAFSAGLLSRIGATAMAEPSDSSLAGVGGFQPFVEVQAVLELDIVAGGTATMKGNYAAFSDPGATDLSVLGRDVLNHFDVVMSRRRDEIALLAGNHRYDIRSA